MTTEQTVAAATTVAPTAKASVTPVAGVVTAVAGRMASAAITAVTSMASVAAVSGHRLLLTAHQGETDHREENRDANYQRTIHTEVLQCKHDSRGKQKNKTRYRRSGCGQPIETAIDRVPYEKRINRIEFVNPGFREFSNQCCRIRKEGGF